MKKIFIMLLLAAVSSAALAEKELYGVLNGTKLTIYYDSNRSARGGMLNWWDGGKGSPSTTTEVIFDASVAEARPTETAGWFSGFTRLKAIKGLAFLNTSEVEFMDGMFSGCESLTSLDVTTFNTSKVESMNNMFAGCASLTGLDLSSFNTSNVTDMLMMFEGCESLTSLDLGSFNTAKVWTMGNMFNNCKSLTSLNLGSFDTGKVTSMSNMFAGCESMTSIDLSNFNTAALKNMDMMFWRDSALVSVNLSSFNTGNVTTLMNTFDGCASLPMVDLSSFNTSNVKYTHYMFQNCTSLKEINIDNFDISNLRLCGSMFKGCSNLEAVYCTKNWSESYTLSNSDNMFAGCTKLKGDDANNPTVYDAGKVDKTYARPDNASTGTPGYFSKPKELYGVFGKNNTLTVYYDGDRSAKGGKSEWWNESKFSSVETVTFDASVAAARPASTAKWFYNCTPLETINGLSYLNTSEVTRMDSMFTMCNFLPKLDLSMFNTEKVTNMSCMFLGCNYLKELNLGSFNTSNVENMYMMFGYCTKLTSLDLTSFNTDKLLYTDGMFFWCSDLETVYCNEDWGASSTLLSSQMMFTGCSKLKGGDAENPTAYDAYEEDATYARPDKPAIGRPGYFTPTQTIPDENPILELDTIPDDRGRETAVTFNLGGPSSPLVLLNMQATDTYDDSRHCVVLNTALEDENIAKLMDNILKGFGDFYSVFSGVSFFLPAGSGEMKLDICTYGLQLSVHIGNSGVAHLTQNERGEAVVKYDITEPTLVCIHASVPQAGSPARLHAPKQTNDANHIELYGIKITPNKTVTAIDETPHPSGENRSEASKLLLNGRLLILHGGKTYTVTGQPAE